MEGCNHRPPWWFVLLLVVTAPVWGPLVLAGAAWSWVYEGLFKPPNRPWTPSLGE